MNFSEQCLSLTVNSGSPVLVSVNVVKIYRRIAQDVSDATHCIFADDIWERRSENGL